MLTAWECLSKDDGALLSDISRPSLFFLRLLPVAHLFF